MCKNIKRKLCHNQFDALHKHSLTFILSFCNEFYLYRHVFLIAYKDCSITFSIVILFVIKKPYMDVVRCVDVLRLVDSNLLVAVELFDILKG